MNGEMRATYVDADEARMLRAMRRYRGDDEARAVGNRFSQQNAVRIAAHAQRNAGREPPPPAPAPPVRRGLEAKASHRAIPVPKVGRGGSHRQFAPIDFVQPRKRQPEVSRADGSTRPDYSAYEPAQLAPYVPPRETREEAKERLQDRIAYGDSSSALRVNPSEVRPRVKPSEAQAIAELGASISAEIAERREFLEEMRAIGKAEQYEAQICGEIAVRQGELKRLAALMSSADGGGAGGGD